MIETKTFGFKNAVKMVEMLSMPPALKRKFVARMGRMVIAQAKKNVKEQRTVSGAPMKARKNPPPKQRPVYHRDKSTTFRKGREEMLWNIVKAKFFGVKLLDESTARVQFFRNAGIVAYKHQHGSRAVFERKPLDEIFRPDEQDRNNPAFYQPCSFAQAMALIRIGYPKTKDWVMKNITVGHAVNLLKKVKTKWPVDIPARPFLGVSDRQREQFADVIMSGLLERFRAAQHANLLT